MAISLSVATAVAAGVAAVAAVTGGALGIVGSVQQHNQAKNNAKMQEQQMNYNKRMEEREAAAIEAETAENARRQRIQAEQLKAKQIALLGKSGAAMTSGSPLAILGQTAADEEMKIQDTHFAGYRQAYQHREQAKMYGYQAGVARAQAPSGSNLALNIAGQVTNTVGNVAQIGGNSAVNKTSLAKSGMAGKSLFG